MSYEYSEYYDKEELIDTLNRQMTKISDLEAKLAESEKKLKDMEHRFLLQYDIRSMYESSYLDLVKRFQALKEQCEKRGKQIVVKSGGKAKKFNEDNAYKLRIELAGADETISQLKQQLAEKEKEIENLYNRLNSKTKFYEMGLEKDYKEYLSRLNRLEKQSDKDKISFAVEQLEKVKHYAQHIQGGLINYIDNQIKQLKETT